MNLQNERVLVTGGSGFLGKNLVKKLSDKTCLMAPTSKKYNLTDERDVMSMYSDCRPDIVIHLAADCGGIEYNNKYPAEIFRNNMAMAMNVIRYAKEYNVKKFVQIGTVCSYPKEPESIPFIEEDLFEGYPEETNAPYGIAKRAIYTMLQAYYKQFGFNFIYLIPANLYGPGDHFEEGKSHVIPALIKKFYFASRRKPPDKNITLWGTGKASRSFLYVEDAVNAIIKATKHYDGIEPANIGPPGGEEYQIKDVAKRIADIIGYEGEILWDDSRPDGQPRRAIETSPNLLIETNFEPEIDLRTGLSETIKWYLWNQGE